MDVKRIAPCMPGAQLTDVIDDSTYKVIFRCGLRSALTFSGTVKFEEIDNQNHKPRVRAQGTDAKGRGAAQAIDAFRLEPAAGGCKVLVHTDLSLSGAVAQYGRGAGMIQATAAALIGQFANNLKAEIAKGGAAPTAAQTTATSATPPAARPISGFSLMAKVLWDAILRLFGRRVRE
jgi:carbon monoxide dehydrogenase subunit G